MGAKSSRVRPINPGNAYRMPDEFRSVMPVHDWQPDRNTRHRPDGQRRQSQPSHWVPPPDVESPDPNDHIQNESIQNTPPERILDPKRIDIQTRHPPAPVITQLNDIPEQADCAVCLREFDDILLPPVCLPCQSTSGRLMRHCVVCNECLDSIIQHQKNGEVECPVCRKKFKVKMLIDSRTAGCLDFPNNKRPFEHTLFDFEPDENPTKRRCLENLVNNAQTMKQDVSGRTWGDPFQKQPDLNHPKSTEELKTLLPNVVVPYLSTHYQLEGQLSRRLASVYIPLPDINPTGVAFTYTTSVSKDPIPNNLSEMLQANLTNTLITKFSENLYPNPGLSMDVAVAVITAIRATYNDDVTIPQLMEPGYLRHYFTTSVADVPNQFKTLVYAYMFRANQTDEAVSQEAVRYAANILKPLVTNEHQIAKNLTTMIWLAVGRTVLSYIHLFLLSKHDDYAASG